MVSSYLLRSSVYSRLSGFPDIRSGASDSLNSRYLANSHPEPAARPQATGRVGPIDTRSDSVGPLLPARPSAWLFTSPPLDFGMARSVVPVFCRRFTRFCLMDRLPSLAVCSSLVFSGAERSVKARTGR